VLFWIVGAWAAWIPLVIVTNRITYAFYLLPTVPALCLGRRCCSGACWISPEAVTARGCYPRMVAFMVFLHLAVFCLLSPVRLSISIPVSLLVLAFSLSCLGYAWRTMLSAVLAVAAGLLGLRYILYSRLEGWFGSDTILGNYPASMWFWIVGGLITLALMARCFCLDDARVRADEGSLRSQNKGKSRVAAATFLPGPAAGPLCRRPRSISGHRSVYGRGAADDALITGKLADDGAAGNIAQASMKKRITRVPKTTWRARLILRVPTNMNRVNSPQTMK